MPLPPFDARLQFVDPELDAPIIDIAKKQPPFIPIRAGIVLARGHESVRYQTEEGSIVNVNTLVFAFRPTKEQRDAIEQGEDIYLSLLTFMNPMPALIMGVGKDFMSAVYNVRPTGDQAEWILSDGKYHRMVRFQSGIPQRPHPGPVDPPGPPPPMAG